MAAVGSLVENAGQKRRLQEGMEMDKEERLRGENWKEPRGMDLHLYKFPGKRGMVEGEDPASKLLQV